MKTYLAYLSLIAFIIIGCQPQSDLSPVEQKRKALKDKKGALATLKSEIKTLEEELLVLDPPKEKPRKLVTTAIVKPKDFERFVEVQGSVHSDEVVYASSETGGRLTRVIPLEGQYVKKGSLVASVDLETINKQQAELETSLSLAKDVYDRQKRLWDQKIGTEMQFLQAKNNVERLEKSLETLDFQLTKSSVYAPISGIVEMVFLKSGELAGPGTPIIQILNTAKVKVKVDVPERYLKSVKRGTSVKIEFPALGETRNARVSRISPTIKPGNRTFEVIIDMSNPGAVLKPNLLATVYFKDFSQKNAVVIPLETVQQEIGGDNYVYVKGTNDNGDIAKKILIATGESDRGEVIITDGLKGGEELIIKGALGLGENELIKVESETALNTDAKPQNNG